MRPVSVGPEKIRCFFNEIRVCPAFAVYPVYLTFQQWHDFLYQPVFYHHHAYWFHNFSPFLAAPYT